ncbi:MAG TPA: hypothetical protein VF053_05555 [Streptosporangiales bacterium]
MIDKILGWLGVVGIAAGVGLTVWSMAQARDVNSVGLAAIFVIGIPLVYAGFFHLMPTEIGFGDKGSVKMRAAAEATRAVKDSAKHAANEIAASPERVKDVMGAVDQDAAEQAVRKIVDDLVSRLPATCDVLNKVHRVV